MHSFCGTTLRQGNVLYLVMWCGQGKQKAQIKIGQILTGVGQKMFNGNNHNIVRDV